MPTKEALKRAAEAGRTRAKEIIQRSTQVRAAAARAFQGYLVAEGDSWFDYPAFEDILESLESEHNFKVRSAAHHGDTVTSMAYEPSQLQKVHNIIRDLSEDGKKARAILVSGAGNDVIDALSILLNHRSSGLEPVNQAVFDGVVGEQLPTAFVSLLGSISGFSETYFGELRPILIHGYSAPVPDGRGYPLLGLSGPWLKPAFARRGYVSADPQPETELLANRDVMAELMRLFNDEILPSVADAAGPHVSYVDVRGALTNDIVGQKYKVSWRDEMHATKTGYRAIAALIASKVDEVAPAVP